MKSTNLSVLTAVKCIKQSYAPNEGILAMMETFRQMTNECLRIGVAANISTMKKLSRLCYPVLAGYDIYSKYKLHAISKAAGMLATRKKSIRRAHPTKYPYMRIPCLASSYGFKIVGDLFRIPITASGSGHDTDYFDIPLGTYVRGVLSDPAVKARSFILTEDKLSICISKEATKIVCIKVVGVDRNLENLAVGNDERVTIYSLSKAVKIAENTRSIIGSFRRNDVRIRKKIASKYGKRRAERIRQLMHHVSKAVVERAKEQKTAITLKTSVSYVAFIRRAMGKVEATALD